MRGHPPAGDYRARLYAHYAENHMAAAANPATVESMAYDAKVFRRRFGPLLPPDRQAAVFEVGAGAGSFLKFLAEEGYVHAEGLEQDAVQVAMGARLGVVNLRQGDAREKLAASKSAFDCVVAIDVIEHLRKDELFGFLDDARRALKPGGVLLWRAPNADGPFFGRMRYGDLTHENAFTRHSAWQLMRAAGFVDVEVAAEEPIVTGARSALRFLLWKLCSAAARVYLFAESYESGSLLTANLIVRARKP